jgi:hypothetical protein
MLNELIPLALVAALVPLAAIMIFRMLGKTKRTKRPVHSFRLGTK